MKIENENALNFRGDFIIKSSLSSKPKSCIKKVKNELQELIKNKDYNLYLRQDFSTNEINIAAGKLYPFYNGKMENGQHNISIVSRASRYIEAAKNTISKYEEQLREKEQREWEKQQREWKKQHINKFKEDVRDIIGTVVFAPLFLINDCLYAINKQWGKKFEELIGKII